METRNLRIGAVVVGLALGCFGVALAGGGTATIPGHLGLHGAAGDPPADVVVDTSVGGEVKRIAALIPDFSYAAPTGGTDVGGTLSADTNFVAGTYHYDGANMTGGTLTFSGGGEVHLHFRSGGVNLDATQISLQNGTTLVLYSDTTVDFNSVTYLGNGQVQVQAVGDVTVRTTSFRGAALANNTLTLSGDLANIALDDSLLTASQAGSSRSLRIMPIVEK